MEMLLFYYAFSVLFMIGYVNFNGMKAWEIVGACLLILTTSPIVLPINVGYYFRFK